MTLKYNKKQATISKAQVKIADKWYGINSREAISSLRDIILHHKSPDFLMNLLPFIPHPRSKIKREEEYKLLSYAWCLYNKRTIIIEQQILLKYCSMALCSMVAIPTSYMERISQIVVDESYHALMSHIGISRIESFRNIGSVFDYTTIIESELALNEANMDDDYWLYIFACALVSEVTLTSYLNIFPRNSEVQNLCRVITNIHRHEEASHGPIFIEIYSYYKSILSAGQLTLLESYITRFISIFMDPDRIIWIEIYKKIGLSYQDIIPNPDYNKIFNFSTLRRGKAI